MMRLSFASYNIHKGIGADRRRDNLRALKVLEEMNADIVGLQEVDRRFGQRMAVLDRLNLEQHGWQIASVPHTPASMGWHGNLILVREGLHVERVDRVHLPRLEARGALQAVLQIEGQRICVTSMHLDLSGLRRRQQLATVCAASRATGLPSVMLGDLNEWSPGGVGLRGLAPSWSVVTPGRTFPARRPLLSLDRVMHTPHWNCLEARVAESALARQASDHLPIAVSLELSA